MLDRELLVNEVAAYKKDSKKHFDEAVAALLALAWPKRRQGFSFLEGDDDTIEGAMDICIALSDKCADSAKKRLLATISDALEGIDGEAAWDEVFGEDEQERYDMAASHLLDLLAVWIGVAVANKWTEGYTRVMISRYLANPYLCPEWKNIPRSALAWGRGYAKDVSEQIALLGQDLILGGARFAEWSDAVAMGATYYIRRRGSGYDCPECDALCGYPIPIDEPFEFLHARCMCWAEYHYEPIPTI